MSATIFTPDWSCIYYCDKCHKLYFGEEFAAKCCKNKEVK